MPEDLGTIGLEIETRGYEQVMENLDRLLAKTADVTRAYRAPVTPALKGQSSARSAQGELNEISLTANHVSKSLRSVLGRSFDQFLTRGADAKSLLRDLEKEALAFGSSLFTGKRQTTGGDLFSGLFSGAGDLLSRAFAGFASGGEFRVGGAAGRDRNLVGLRLSRGEQVRIQTPSQQRREKEPAAAGNFTFNYQISTPDVDGFRRSQGQLQAEALKSARRVLDRNG
ncbi:hypothetical protein [Sneathiella glossodoripedis]|uniref:hypothetical protein n=1 Tax=Sneathiella glossodoripedis TaxID=418853 RepID=UPI00046FB120|nr:hypothetical protein [Sneathiella glossodoripedis]